MIIKITYSSFDLAEITALARELHAIVKTSYPEEAGLTTALQTLEAALHVAETSLGSSNREALTDEIIKADDRRDESFVSLRDHIEAGTRRQGNAPYQQASERLKVIFDENGRNLYRKALARQSAMLSNLFVDLRSSEALKDLAMVNATEWLSELQADEERFKQLYNSRKAQKEMTTNTLPGEEVKKDLKNAIEVLLAIVNGLHQGEILKDSEEVVETINKNIEEATKKAG